LHFSSGKIVGVHTNGGCENMGFNYGQRITNLLATSTILRSLLSTPLSTIVPLPIDELRSQTDGGTGPLVKNDSRSTLVKTLQTLLKKLGFDLGNAGPNSDGIDGKFGNKTFDAVVKFQNTHTDLSGNQLTADGKVGKLTGEALNKAAGV
jgi:peptidoglycan hydrolase-like protein with peptidoglycan-binding domain